MPSTGAIICGTGENNAGIGATAWTSPTNIQADDTTNLASCNAAASSQYLVARNFGFALPTNARIVGVTLAVDAAESSAGSELINAQIQDNGSALIGSVVANTVNGTTLTVYPFGGANNLWGTTTLTPAMVSSANFGVRLWFTTAHNVTVDYVSMDIEYVIDTPWVWKMTSRSPMMQRRPTHKQIKNHL